MLYDVQILPSGTIANLNVATNILPHHADLQKEMFQSTPAMILCDVLCVIGGELNVYFYVFKRVSMRPVLLAKHTVTVHTAFVQLQRAIKHPITILYKYFNIYQEKSETMMENT